MTNGNEFTVGAQPLGVTKLGVFAGSGLMQESYVGIWRVSDQMLLGSATVAPGAFTQIQDWLFADVAPFTLSATAEQATRLTERSFRAGQEKTARIDGAVLLRARARRQSVVSKRAIGQ
jgi:hypothetical protein